MTRNRHYYSLVTDNYYEYTDFDSDIMNRASSLGRTISDHMHETPFDGIADILHRDIDSSEFVKSMTTLAARIVVEEEFNFSRIRDAAIIQMVHPMFVSENNLRYHERRVLDWYGFTSSRKYSEIEDMTIIQKWFSENDLESIYFTSSLSDLLTSNTDFDVISYIYRYTANCIDKPRIGFNDDPRWMYRLCTLLTTVRHQAPGLLNDLKLIAETNFPHANAD